MKIAEYKGVSIYADMVELGKIIGSFKTDITAYELYYGASFQEVFEECKLWIDIMDRRGEL